MAKQTQPKEDILITKIAKHTYTTDELNTLQKALALAVQDLRHKEEDKKAIMSELTSDINKLHAETGSLSDRINSGYEYRSMKCVVKFDFPTGTKDIVHPETGEVISTEKITDEDRQQYLI